MLHGYASARSSSFWIINMTSGQTSLSTYVFLGSFRKSAIQSLRQSPSWQHGVEWPDGFPSILECQKTTPVFIQIPSTVTHFKPRADGNEILNLRYEAKICLVSVCAYLKWGQSQTIHQLFIRAMTSFSKRPCPKACISVYSVDYLVSKSADRRC